MKRLSLSLLLILPIGLLKACSYEANASDPAEIECKYLNAWDFKRCENAEIVCYANNEGLSCKFK